jgi:hypothetical protein
MSFFLLKAVVTVERANAISLFGVVIREKSRGYHPAKGGHAQARKDNILTHAPNEQAASRHLFAGVLAT